MLILSRALSGKIDEQIERAEHLAACVPLEALLWTPPIENAWNTGQLLGHLLDCLAGICAVLHAAHPQDLQHFQGLRALPVNHVCGVEEARQRIAKYGQHIREGFALLSDDDLARTIPTVFVPQGEPLLTLLLGNLEHLINHKYQLFTYLRLMGVAVGTPDLYQFRGPA